MIRKRLCAFFIIVLFSGCSSSTSDFYLFGSGNSCFQNGINKNCQKLKAYDEVKLTVNVDRQSVSYVKKAYGLNDKNIVFNTLENCAIVDVDNFSCDGLVRSSGKYTKSDVFKGTVITQSYLLSLNRYFDSEIALSDIRFINDNLLWVNIGCLFVFFGLLSALFKD